MTTMSFDCSFEAKLCELLDSAKTKQTAGLQNFISESFNLD